MTVSDVKMLIRDDDKIQMFINEACRLHANVNQRYDEHPYAYHVLNVVNQAIHGIPSFICDEFKYVIPIILFGAAFHDTIEDARLTYNDVLKIARKYFDGADAVAATEIVYALTNEKGRNRNERANDKYYEGIRNTLFAAFVKYCDRCANMQYSKKTGSSMYDTYQKEMPHFIDAIMLKDTEMIGAEILRDWYQFTPFEPTDVVDSIDLTLPGDITNVSISSAIY